MGDVVSDLDSLALTLKYTKGETYHNVSMGQGQDVIAERLLDEAAKSGHWVILNNVHLMPRWLKRLEKILDDFMNAGDSTHNDYRLFLTSDPSKGIPTGILNRSIKLTNEPPTGLKANLKRAFCTFSKPREMYFEMPVVYCKSNFAASRPSTGIYSCPVYKTRQRGPTYVFSAQLKTKSKTAKWVLGGV